MIVLGISCYYHDSAVAIIDDGKIVAAAQEERFTRIKHDSAFPHKALAWALSECGVALSDCDAVTFYDKPILTFNRLLETYLAFAPKGLRSFVKAIPVWVKDKLFQKDNILKELRQYDPDFASSKLLFAEHHLSHAASAFYASPYDEAVVLTLDGVGEWATATVAIGEQNKLNIVKEIHFPHSLGLLYSAITYYLGFKVNSGEYKVMGLAPYGEPKYVDLFKEHLIDIKDDGSFWLNQDYFNYCTGLTMTNRKFSGLFGHPVRTAEEQLEDFHMDMAASVQAITEEIVLKIAADTAKTYGKDNLCMAGGVALNCVANGKILREGAYKNIWIQPAAGDAGGALGAALLAYHKHFSNERSPLKPDLMKGAYLGPSFSQDHIKRELKIAGAIFEELDDEALFEATAKALSENKVVGWFQGAMEFGPRALGNRSILGNPMSEETQKVMNLKIKFRESFRPFAPAVLREDVSEWFDLDTDSPYMLLVENVAKIKQREMSEKEKALRGIEKLNIARSEIPAVTHVDYSARIQTVDETRNPKFYKLLQSFKHKTGCGVLVNTSFNVRGEPIVCTPRDAFCCFMGTHMDVLVVGNIYLRKEDQDTALLKDYSDMFELD